MAVNIHLLPVLAQYSALFSIVSFSFLLSGTRASIFFLLYLRQVRRSLTHLRASQSCNEAPSSLLYSLSCSGLDLIDKSYFSKNCSRIDLKLFVLAFLRAFGVTFVIVMLIISRLVRALTANLKFADR